MRGLVGGAVSAAAFGQVGDLELRGWRQLAAHGLTGGLVSAASGGDFQSGFLGAGFAAWAGPTVSSWFGPQGQGIARTLLGGGKFGNGALTAAYGYLFNEVAHRKENPAKAIADEALKDGRLSLSEANAIWRANNDPNFELTVDASQLTVKQLEAFRANGRALGRVQGSDWLVHGTVTLERVNGGIEILPGSYDFQPHGSFWDSPVRNFETYGGFYWGSHAGTSVGTDFLIRYSGQPNVVW